MTISAAVKACTGLVKCVCKSDRCPDVTEENVQKLDLPALNFVTALLSDTVNQQRVTSCISHQNACK